MLNKKTWLLLLLTVSLSACNTVDDYLLGKDNTPIPEPLKPIVSKVDVRQKWTTTIGMKQQSNAYLKLKPAIIGKTLYVADLSGNVMAVDTNSGKSVWAKKGNYKVISGMSIAQGIIVYATNDSELVAVKQSDGELLWNKKVSGDVLAKPVIVGNQVLGKTIDGNLYALNLQTGKDLWFSEHGAPGLVLKASSAPVLLNSHVALVGYSDGKLDAIDLRTGQTLWQRSIAYASGTSDVERLVDIDADPIIHGDAVILGSYQGYVGKFSINEGQFIWRKPASIYKNMTLQGNTLFVTDSDDVVWALNQQNGHVKWKQDALKARDLTEPVVSGNRLYLGDKTGILHILDANTGEFLARAPMNGAVIVAPVIMGKSLYVLTSNGKLSRYSVS